MVPIWIFIILGVVQGILEWLPVSSEGQILFLGTLFGISNSDLILSIAFWLHFGTMLSVLILFRKEWFTVINVFDEEGDFLRRFLIITTICTGIVGVPIKIVLLDQFTSDGFGLFIMVILAIALVLTAILLKLQSDFLDGTKELEEMTILEMIITGSAQGLTIIPGVSRSGTTVTTLLFLNVGSDDSFRGSFFMSVPAVLGAVSLDLLDSLTSDSSSILLVDPLGIMIAIVFAMIFGIITMKILIDFAKEVDFSNIVLFMAGLVMLYIALVLII